MNALCHHLSTLLKELSLTSQCPKDIVITHITDDSRQVIKGSLFFALNGEHHHSGRFIRDAIKAGANALITDQSTELPAEANSIFTLKLADPRSILGKMAAAFYGKQPPHQIAVTGTNGKTSTTHFLTQIHQFMGHKAASIGTLGVTSINTASNQHILTTPNAVDLARDLSILAQKNYQYVAMEASSHGLVQQRLSGTHINAAGLTSLGRDHIDYHKTVHNYFDAKLKLFSTYLTPHGLAVAYDNIPEEILEKLKKIAHQRQLQLRLIGEKPGSILRIIQTQPTPHGQKLTITQKDVGTKTIHLPLIGQFQATNALIALALAIPHQKDLLPSLHYLTRLRSVPGRLQKVTDRNGHRIAYIDYAHTPDALAKTIKAVRPHCKGRVLVVFGAGGDRDKGKRPLMGKVVNTLADEAFVTDDNPRDEDPQKIRADILKACPKAKEVPHREDAIAMAIHEMRKGDVLIVAGKGHEKDQTIKGKKYPFDDVKVTQDCFALHN